MSNRQKLSVNDHSHDLPLDSGGESIGRREFLSLIIAASLATTRGLADAAEDTRERFRKMSEDAERRGLAEPFRGITNNGKLVEGLFPIQPRPEFLLRRRGWRRKNFSPL
jgi:hypothetical protein